MSKKLESELFMFPTWPKESYSERVRRCIAVLYLNGVITNAERCKAHERLDKQPEKPLRKDGDK